MNVREFLVELFEEDIVEGKTYSLRYYLDNASNTYIGFNVDIETYNLQSPTTRTIRLYRHTNNIDNLNEVWGFGLGDCIYYYPKNKDMLIEFRTYGMTLEEAEQEASKYFKIIKNMVKKESAAIKIRQTEDAEAEKQELLARLEALG